jgi:flagellar biosynthesis/type III secretory pathway protein FliH
VEHNAYCRGFADGEKSGFEQGERSAAEAGGLKLDSLIESFRRGLSELQGLRRRSCRELEAEIARLALGVARKIIGREAGADPGLVAGAIREAFGRVEHAEAVTVRLCPSDLAHLNETRPRLLEELARGGRTRLEPDASLSPGGCLLETDCGDIDARIEGQLRVVEEAFRAEWSRDAEQKD